MTAQSTSGLIKNVSRSPLPMPPDPIKATRILSFGLTAVWPEADRGFKAPPSRGAAAAATTDFSMKRRRESERDRVMSESILGFIFAV
jgi:hypothetical protein